MSDVEKRAGDEVMVLRAEEREDREEDGAMAEEEAVEADGVKTEISKEYFAFCL